MMWELSNLSANPQSPLSTLLDHDTLFYPFMLLHAKNNHAMASIKNYYFLNQCFFDSDTWIMENLYRIQGIPGIIVQGQQDQICSWENAYKVHLAWSVSDFILVPDAGHASTEPSLLEALVDATEKFKDNLKISSN